MVTGKYTYIWAPALCPRCASAAQNRPLSPPRTAGGCRWPDSCNRRRLALNRRRLADAQPPLLAGRRSAEVREHRRPAVFSPFTLKDSPASDGDCGFPIFQMMGLPHERATLRWFCKVAWGCWAGGVLGCLRDHPLQTLPPQRHARSIQNRVGGAESRTLGPVATRGVENRRLSAQRGDSARCALRPPPSWTLGGPRG